MEKAQYGGNRNHDAHLDKRRLPKTEKGGRSSDRSGHHQGQCPQGDEVAPPPRPDTDRHDPPVQSHFVTMQSSPAESDDLCGRSVERASQYALLVVEAQSFRCGATWRRNPLFRWIQRHRKVVGRRAGGREHQWSRVSGAPQRRRTPRSYDALGSFVFIPLGAAVAGPATESVGVTETLAGAAAVIVAATALVLLIDEVRNLRRTDVVSAPV